MGHASHHTVGQTGRQVCLLEDDALYLHSHMYIRPRTGSAEWTDAQPNPDCALTEKPVSSGEADLDSETGEGLQSAMQASLTCGGIVKKSSIVRLSNMRKRTHQPIPAHNGG